LSSAGECRKGAADAIQTCGLAVACVLAKEFSEWEMGGTWKVNQGLAGVSGITPGCVLIDAVETTREVARGESVWPTRVGRRIGGSPQVIHPQRTADYQKPFNESPHT
jgi:hypothetical protein